MQKSSSVLRLLGQGWMAWVPKALPSSAPKGNSLSTHGIRPVTCIPPTDLQNMSLQRLAEASRLKVREETHVKMQQFLPGQATALHNIWYKQMSKSPRALTTIVPRENFSAMPYPLHRAVAGMVCDGCVRPLTSTNYNVSMYAKVESNVAALPVGGHLPVRRMSSWSRSGVVTDEGGPSSSFKDCQQSSGEGSLSSCVDPTWADMSVKHDSSALLLLHSAVKSGFLQRALPARPQSFSGRRLMSTQILQRKPVSSQLSGSGGVNFILGMLARPKVFTKQLSQISPRSSVRADKEHSLKILETDAAWALRLSSENVFLSWCRNTYLGSALGLAMHTAGAGLMYADTAAFLIFALAGLNLVWGSCAYVHYLYSMGSLAQISRVSRLLQSFFALVQVLLWCYACMCYFSSWDVDLLEAEDKFEA